MDAIIGFFEGIGQAISTAFSFLVTMIADLVWLIQMLFWALGQLPAFFAWIPPGLSALIIGTFAAVAIYKIMGREG